MANIMQTTLTISGSKENIEKIANLVLTNDEWVEQVNERNKGLDKEFATEVPKDYMGNLCPIDFNRLIPTPTNIYQKGISSKEEEKYGKENCWYDWNCRHWGTKWNAFDTIVTRTETSIYIEMDTAYNVPTPYLEKLAELCVEHHCDLYGLYAEEFYSNDYMGRINLVDGELYVENEVSAEIFEEVWGYNPEEVEEEED